MAIKNTGTDLDGTARNAVKAADLLGHAKALAGDPTPHADELTQMTPLLTALRGRGIAHPLLALLAIYDGAGDGAQLYSREVALACAATPGTIDDSRSVMNT